MKYGLIFLLLGLVFLGLALTDGFWHLILLWPCLSFLWVGLAYLLGNVSLFGKQPSGQVLFYCRLLLFPYWICLRTVWEVLRRCSGADPYHLVNDQLVISRRLTAGEFQALNQKLKIDHVIDLTCEFSQPAAIVKQVQYFSFPILDGGIVSVESLQLFLTRISTLKGRILIHCAQGHGRTGLVTACLLIFKEKHTDGLEVIEELRRIRPGLQCNPAQRELVKLFAQRASLQNV